MQSDKPFVVLFRPKSAYGVVYIPWALLLIAAPLVRDGVEVQIVDENSDPDWRKTLATALKRKPVCLGVTALTGRMLVGAIEASKMVSGTIPVVWGGVHASLMPEQTLRASYVDYLVSGEGEVAFPRLIKYLTGKADGPAGIPGVYYKSGGEVKHTPPGSFINLAGEPPVPYDLVNMEAYVSGWFGAGGRVLDIFTSRGCPHRCRFCYNPAFNARKWRSLDPEVSVERIEDFVRRFKLDGIIVRDDFYFANPKRVGKISELFISKGLNIKWEADCRVDVFSKFDDDYLAKLKRSGLHKLVFGIESGSPRMLEAIGKDITLDDLWKTLDGLKRHGLSGAFHFIIGFPGETKDEILETYALIDELKKKLPRSAVLGPNIYTPYPGTELFDDAVKLGFTPPATPEEWTDFEGWTTARAPWVTPELEAMMEVSRIYFRLGDVFPALDGLMRIRKELWKKSAFTPKIERKALSAMLSLGAATWVKKLNLRRWANK